MAAVDVRKFVNGRLVASGAELRNNAEPEAPGLAALVASRKFLVISVGNCPQCEELAALLAARGVPAEVFAKWDRSASEYPALKRALSAHAGDVFTFPQVFAEGSYQGGFQEVLEKVEAGAFDDLFEREFAAEPATLRRRVEGQPMVVFSLPNCPQCDVLYADLQRRGLPVQDIFVKLDKVKPEYASLKAQLQKLTGKEKFTFPQTFVQGDYAGDYDEVIAKADEDAFADTFERCFGIVSAPKVPEPPAVLAFDDDF
eukprot:SRR837773.7635.p2 GENE.SRR837773.7635~~SRR837773.7635.p2  ORF type:complete len:267 (-),score=112.63 SRR837773.7635:142-912(-)